MSARPRVRKASWISPRISRRIRRRRNECRRAKARSATQLEVNRDLMTRTLEFQVTFPVRHRLCRCREAVGRVQLPPLDARIGRGQARDHRVQREVDEDQNDAPGAAGILQAGGNGRSLDGAFRAFRVLADAFGTRDRLAHWSTVACHASHARVAPAGAAGVGACVCAPGSPRGRPRSTRGTVRKADREPSAPHSGDMKTQQPGIDARIVGIGACRPRRIVSDEELTARTGRSDDWIRRRTGNHGTPLRGARGDGEFSWRGGMASRFLPAE